MSTQLDDPIPKRRILIIDDEPAVLKLITEFLTRSDYAVATAGGGHEGLRRFEEEPCDLVICDRWMPDLIGDDVAAELKCRAPAIPIILISGHSGGGLDRELFTAFLAKPFTHAQVIDAVSEALGAPGQ